jgi:2-dehydro-3-deoxyphosphogluconate aldolase/(4S)-4-hydroxy-2-oxoglutarate aldolase
MSEGFSSFYAQLHHAALVPIVRISSEDDAYKLADALEKRGFDALIVCYEGEKTLSIVKALATLHPEMLVGISEIVTTSQLDAAKDAGASFVTVPNYTQAICEHGLAVGVPVISVTVDEGIMPAGDAPTLPSAELFGAAFKGSTYMPMGGVSPQDVTRYLASPYIEAIGVTDWMVKPQLLAKGDFAEIEKDLDHAHELLQATGR